MQPTRLYGEWTVSFELLNVEGNGVELPFDIGQFSSIKLYAAYSNRRFVLATWHGCMDDLLDALVKFSDAPDYPNMVVEVRYENQHEKLAGSLKAARGKYLTAMELRTGQQSEAYMELHKYLTLDSIKSWMPADAFQEGVDNVTRIVGIVINSMLEDLPPDLTLNATAMEAALIMAEDALGDKVPAPLPPAFVRAYQNVVDRLNRGLTSLGLTLTCLRATIMAGYIFPTVGIRTLEAVRTAQMRKFNQPIGPVPPQPSEFSDSFPL